MDVAIILARQTGVMFLLMAIGYALARRKIIREASSKDLGKLLLNVVIPAVIVKSFWITCTPERALAVATTFVVSLMVLALSILLGRAIFPHDGTAEFAADFSNAGFIGIPLVSATFGEDAVLLIVSLIAQLNILQWTYGQRRISGDTAPISARTIMTSPMLLACLAGLALFVTNAPEPKLIASCMDMLAGLNTPLAMMILGFYLANGNLLDMAKDRRLYRCSIVRLVVIPLATIALLVAVPCDATIKLVILVAAAAPTGANVALFCQQLGKDYGYACGLVCMSTLLSIATLPLIAAVGTLILR